MAFRLSKLFKTTTILSFLVLTTACNVSNAESSNPETDIKARLAESFPKALVQSVNKTPIDGVYEVVLQGNQIIYVDRKADYLLEGELVDLKAKKSVTQARMAELNRIDFAKLPFDDSITIVRGDGSRKLAVFSDPDCPYCKQLENGGLKDINNVTIHLFLYPLDSLHPDARRKSKMIWCAKDRAAAWNNYMREGKLPDNAGSCETPIDRNEALAMKHGITGTPGIVFPNGKLAPGALGAEQIEAGLSAK